MGDDGDSKANIAWTLRYAMDAVTADMGGSSRTTTQTWLPTASEAASMDALCLGRTSAAQGLMYDPSNEYILDIDDYERGNSTFGFADDLIGSSAISRDAVVQGVTSGGFVALSGCGLKSIVTGILWLGVLLVL